MKVSPSMLKTFGDCALQGKYKYVDRLPDDQTGSSAHWGTSLHHAAEMFIKGSLDKDAAVREFTEYYDSVTPDYWNRRTSYTNQKDTGKRVIEDYVDNYNWERRTPIAAEHRFMVDIGEHQISGIVDLIDVWDDPVTLNIVDYKGLALDTPIPTPSGWTTMGDLKVGDEVFGGDGRPCRVNFKSDVHMNPTFLLKLEDGTQVVCDNEHRWNVSSGPKYVEQTLTTQQIHDTVKDPIKGGNQHRIFNSKPLELSESSLVIDPYVLGYWLGNGKWSSSEVTSGDPEVFDIIRSKGYEVGEDTGSNSSSETRSVYGLITQLKSEGIYGGKHVPVAYLRSSVSQRLELLRGFMDSDGSYNKVRNQAVFVNTNERLAEAVYELVVSLGMRASLWSGKYSGFGVTGIQYKVHFSPSTELNPFSLTRKADLVPVSRTAQSLRRMITSVESIKVVPTQCIGVDSEDSTYLCTKSMLVTHNSGARPKGGAVGMRLNIQFSAYIYASQCREFWTGYPGQEEKYPGLPNGEALFEAFQDVPRKGIWYDLKKNQEVDVGPRTDEDYGRLYRIIEQIDRAIEYEVFVPSVNADWCEYCFVKDTLCPVIPEGLFEQSVEIGQKS